MIYCSPGSYIFSDQAAALRKRIERDEKGPYVGSCVPEKKQEAVKKEKRKRNIPAALFTILFKLICKIQVFTEKYFA